MSCIGGSSSNASNKGKGKEIVEEVPPVAEEKQQLSKGKEIVGPAVESDDGYESDADFESDWHSDSEEEKDEQQQQQQQENNEGKPPWLDTLLRTRFWDPCDSIEHGSKNRADKCMFCLKCSEVSCPRCTHRRPGHRLLKIRRYVYRSVVHSSDMHELGIDVSKIQTYVINARKVLHLRPMNRSKHFRPQAGTPRCITCRTWLRSTPNLYCSLVCEGNFDISQDDFSGPEAELRYRSLQVNMAQPTEADAEELRDRSLQVNMAQPSEADAEELQLPTDSEVEHDIPAQVEPPPPPAPPAANQNVSLRKWRRKQANPMRAPFF